MRIAQIARSGILGPSAETPVASRLLGFGVLRLARRAPPVGSELHALLLQRSLLLDCRDRTFCPVLQALEVVRRRAGAAGRYGLLAIDRVDADRTVDAVCVELNRQPLPV